LSDCIYTNQQSIAAHVLLNQSIFLHLLQPQVYFSLLMTLNFSNLSVVSLVVFLCK